MRALVIGGVLALAIAGEAVACTPPPNWTPELQGQLDDELLLRANFIYRGVIEEPRNAFAGAPLELTDMRIRLTRLYWGTGAPEVVPIRYDDLYYARCARGNLHATVQLGGNETGWPQIREGLGVTVIGRIGNEAPDLLILVDGAPDTVETLRRFETNLRNLER